MPIRRIGETTSPDKPLPPARARTRPVPPLDRSPPAEQQEDTASVPEGTYKVGYKKPPRHSQFKPGQSGNPKGRPKAAKGLHTIARDLLTQKVAVRTTAGEKKISRMEAVMHKTHELAMKGNIRALAELLKLYANAVPEQRSEATGDQAEDLSATDLAMLKELRRMLGTEQEAAR